VMYQASERSYYPADAVYSMRVLMFIAFLSMGYAISRPNETANTNQDLLLADANQDSEVLLQWQRTASEKAVRNYSEAQEKKWRNWNEAMFERSP
jgi:hypothetical protein